MKTKYLLLIFFIVIIVLMAVSPALKDNKIIGIVDSPGLQGEILFQENIIYNIKKGNVFKYFDTDYLNYPNGERLHFALANSFHLFLYAPLRIFLGPIRSYNMLLAIIVLLNFLSAYLLAKYLFRSKAVASFSSLLFGLNSYILLKIDLGFIQKFAVFWIPLYMLMLLKLRGEKSHRYLFSAAIILCAMQLFYPPYSYYAILFTMVLMSYALAKRDEMKFAMSRFLLIVFFLISATSLIYYAMGFGFAYLNNPWHVINNTAEGSLNLFNPFKFFPYVSDSRFVHLPLGISVLAFTLSLFGAIGKKGIPRLLGVVFVVFLLLAAGPYLTFGGRAVTIFGHRVLLPFYFMSQYIPFASGIYFPIRLFPFINLCLSLMAGYGMIYVSDRFRVKNYAIAALVFSVIYVAELATLLPELFPPAVSKVIVPDIYRIAKKGDCKAVLNLPQSTDRKIINRYGLYASLSGKRLVNSYYKKDIPFYIPKNKDYPETKKRFIRFLSACGIDYIILHEYLLREGDKNPADDISWLDDYCDVLNFPEEGISAYRIRSAN
ncbi:MAG: hypothetical protein JW800_00680 [Candidatus Omnitrophica bacterium]|nr:hypothetical protein [Candidatus Omnitrophota bacterium]